MDDNCILITGARENNLKNIDVKIPKGKLVVFTGVSGSGKSSLVFDTVAAEAARQLNETFPPFIRNRLPRHEPPKAESIDCLTPAIVVDQRAFAGDLRSTVSTMTDAAPMLRVLFSRCAEPRLGLSSAYSWNDPQGMCPACGGLGMKVELDPERMVDESKSLNQGALLFPNHQVGTYQWQLYANSGLYDPDKPLRDFTPEERSELLHGTGHIVEIHNITGTVLGSTYHLQYEGYFDRIERLFLRRDLDSQSKASQRNIQAFTKESPCPVCGGARLSAAALGSRLCGLNIAEMGDLEIDELIGVLDGVTDPVGVPTVRKIQRVLRGVSEMGLGYLCLNRPAPTLSGGEAQRLKVVRHLGSNLVGMTYIFDEPSAGLHPKDTERLCRLLLRLRDRGNTVLVVEHNKEVMRAADVIVDMGPGAGAAGGRVVFQGTMDALLKADTPTAGSLRQRVPVNDSPRAPGEEGLWIRDAVLHNLQHVNVRIPLHVLTAVSGLAGAGKSSLVCGELIRQHPEAVHISQAPIGTTVRSSPATYIGVMDEIRRLFARENRVSAALFSYNSKGGCPVCRGRGEIKTEMAFLDPVTMPCEACHGSRYSDEALSYRYKGRNILEVLDLTVAEALEVFDEPAIRQKLRPLADVGMGYVTLGQPTSTLSGGECQRIKLASRLRSKSSVYVMDEPSSGLHPRDIGLLMGLLNRLVDAGNTIIVVEHDLDVIRRADWVIDLGPGGGRNGGRVLFEGTPRALLSCRGSATAEFLRRDLGLPPLE